MASDFTRIGANVPAMQSMNSFNSINNRIATHQLRLATGKRINSAGDDPAGYQLAKTLDSRSRGLQVAFDNVSNAQNLLNIAEGGYQSIMDILQTAKEKATQAADGLYSATQRTALNDQVSALISEIEDIVSETTFNGSNLINGSYSATSFQTGETAGDTLSVALQSSDSAALSVNNISLATQASASTAITTLNTAITTLSQRIQDVGEYKARLSSKEGSLSVAVTNTEAVRSTIEDADFAREQMEMMKLQIVQQTALSSLTQSNAAPQMVLGLFG
jgi:flagellin